MNTLYVTVSIPLLLVLAGFNHAHGLTTFGKSNNQQTSEQPKPSYKKPCKNGQADCAFVRGTTCINEFCVCGDNSNPINGACKAQKQGPRHICNDQKDCVENAECLPPIEGSSNNSPSNDNAYKYCHCLEGFYEIGHMCAGARKIGVVPGLSVVVLAIITKLFN